MDAFAIDPYFLDYRTWVLLKFAQMFEQTHGSIASQYLS